MRHAIALVLGFASFTLFAAPERPTRGLLGHWDFTEVMGGLSPDGSDTGDDAELQGASQVQGPFGKALAFAGNGAAVVIPGLPDLNGSEEMTVSCWALWQETGQYPNIVTGGTWSPGGFLVFVNNDSCSFRMGRPGHSAVRAGDQWREISAGLVPKIVKGRWYHLTATFKRPNIVTYVDGKRVGAARWDHPVGHEGDIRLGTWGGKNTHRGLVDELKLHNQALTAAEVLAEFTATQQGRNPEGQSPAWQPAPEDHNRAPTIATYKTAASELTVDTLGRIASLRSLPDGRELVRAPMPLVALQRERRRLTGSRCRKEGDELAITLRRGGGEVKVKITPRKRHFRIELTEVPEGDSLTFGQVAAETTQDAGTMAGLLADDTHGICMRALNLDTKVQLTGGRRGLAATTYAEHGLGNGAIALVASRREDFRPILQEVAVAEKMPVSKQGGPWAMDAEETRGSYLFAHVTEANVGEWIEVARRGGFTNLHYSGWGTSLGHYKPRKSAFPNGMEGMKGTVKRIHDAGLKAGIHTLTGCISTNDPWVTPVADPRLVPDASYTLAKDLGPQDTEIFLNEPFGNHDVVWSYAGNGNVVRIGGEMIHYTEIAKTKPYALRKCIRGAFRTRPGTHQAGVAVDHLLQRYLAFYPEQNSTLVGELADCIAEVFNTCEMDEIYFDGSEGMRHWRGIPVMRHAIFNRLKRPALTEASCWGHHNWWFHSRLGAWDHPKWAPKRFTDMHIASAEDHRRRDLLEPQLGWWALIGPSPVSRGMFPEEVEYFIGKTMSIDAPMSIQGVNVGSRPPNARQNEFFTILGWYENLRLSRYFTEKTCQSLREPGKEIRLRQGTDGNWQFHPLATLKHHTGAAPDTWTVQNPHATQPLRLRLEALYAPEPYDSPQQVTIADFADLKTFGKRGQAAGVSLDASLDTKRTKEGPHSLRLVAANKTAERNASWAKFGTSFKPYLDIRPGNAIGLWVHGDGKGAILNVQLENPREHTHCYAEHYIDLNFTGWKYVEIPLRERSADRYHDYKWPYYSQHGIFRNRLQQHVVNGLNLYVNNIPQGEQVEVLVSPIRALPIRSVPLSDLALTVNGTSVALPALAASGSYLEVDETTQGTVRDARGEILATFPLGRDWPQLRSGQNTLQLAAKTATGYRARTDITILALGQPFGERNAAGSVDWTRLGREYTRPRTIHTRETAWDLSVRPDAKSASFELSLALQGNLSNPDLHNRPENTVIEPCDDSALFQLSQVNTYAKYAYDADSKGVPAKPGVSHTLAVVTDLTKTGKALRYTATSKRDDNGGWGAKGRRFSPPLDLSGGKGMGFWLHGDGKGEYFKAQMRDTKGMWHDMVTRVDFTGWRYISFAWEKLRLDPSKVEYIIFYYNGIPAGATVTCVVDDLRALRSTVRVPPATLDVNGKSVRLPIGLGSGDRLRLAGASCELISAGQSKRLPLPFDLPSLRPGANRVRLLLDLPKGATAKASITKIYPRK